MKRIILAASLTPLLSGCTTAYVAATEGTARPSRVFHKALEIDTQCLAFPLVALSDTSHGGGDPMMALYIVGGVFAYGAIDFPFTLSSYVLYRTTRVASEKIDEIIND